MDEDREATPALRSANRHSRLSPRWPRTPARFPQSDDEEPSFLLCSARSYSRRSRRLMSLAEITRIRRPRNVNTTKSRRPVSVCPKARNRGSADECSASESAMRGRLKNTCSASPGATSCRSQILSALLESQSNPSHRERPSQTSSAIFDVYHGHIQQGKGFFPGRIQLTKWRGAKCPSTPQHPGLAVAALRRSRRVRTRSR
jgi:hypothetical protein